MLGKIPSMCCVVLLMWGASNAFGFDYYAAIQPGAEDNGNWRVKDIETHHIDVVPDEIKENARQYNGLRYAIADLSYALDRIENHPVALNLLAFVAQLLHRHELALARFKKAIDKYPQYVVTRLQFGLFLASIGSFDEAITVITRAIEMDPKLPSGYAALAHVFSKKGDAEQGRAAAQKARELGFRGKLPDGF